MLKTVNILNKRAKFDYEIIETYTAGIVLTGTEIKSIRLGKANITEGFCEFHNGELFAINTQIDEYLYGNQFNHKAKSERKLLLNKRELKKTRKKYRYKRINYYSTKTLYQRKRFGQIRYRIVSRKENLRQKRKFKRARCKTRFRPNQKILLILIFQ